jgi:hypothetical protein
MTPTLTGTLDGYPFSAGHTRAELRAEVARYFRHHSFAATGGSTSSVVNAAFTRFGDDYFVGANLWIEQADGAAPQGEDTYCTAFVSSTGTFTCSPAFSAAVASGDKVQVFMQVTKAEIDAALAKNAYGARALYSLTPSTSSVDYSLNAIPGLHSTSQLTAVWRRELEDIAYPPYRVMGFQVADDFGALTLRLPGTLYASDGLWIEYIVGEDYLLHDGDRVNLPVELVKLRCVVWLIGNCILPRQDNTGLQHWGTLLRDLRDSLTREERQRVQPAGKVQGVQWDRGRARDGAAALGLTENYGGDFANFP